MMYLGDPGESWGHQDRPLGADPKNPVLVYSMGMVHGNSTKHKNMDDFHWFSWYKCQFHPKSRKKTNINIKPEFEPKQVRTQNPYHDWLSAHVFTATKSPRFPLVWQLWLIAGVDGWLGLRVTKSPRFKTLRLPFWYITRHVSQSKHVQTIVRFSWSYWQYQKGNQVFNHQTACFIIFPHIPTIHCISLHTI